MKLDRTARRLLGSLVEKRLTTPDQYPLTLNSLVLACNQSSNRDPVTALEAFEVEGCLRQLMIEGLVTRMERDGGRTDRWKERLTESLHVTEADMAVIAELLLRGPQTEPELSKRASRMAPVGTPEEVTARLQRLAEGRLVEHLPRRSGERIARWRHLLGGEEEATTVAVTQAVPSPMPSPMPSPIPPAPAPDAAGSVGGPWSHGTEDASAARSRSEATTRIMGPSHEAVALRVEIDRIQRELDALRARLDRIERA